jgi:hypothetical protein
MQSSAGGGCQGEWSSAAWQGLLPSRGASGLAWAVAAGVEYRVTDAIVIRTGVDYMRTSYFDTSLTLRGRRIRRNLPEIPQVCEMGLYGCHRAVTMEACYIRKPRKPVGKLAMRHVPASSGKWPGRAWPSPQE